jgi:hypothetical protein
MAARGSGSRKSGGIASLLVACSLLAVAGASAQGNKILVCKDAKGQPLATDPSDPRCYTAPPTQGQREREEELRRKEMETYLACKAAQRSDQSLLGRYPDRAKHDAARQQALEGLAVTMRNSQARTERLLAERKTLLEEAEFYPSGNLPARLKRAIDDNGALLDAQRQAVANQDAEAANINKFYDDELAKLKTLWAPQRGEARACVQPRIVKEPR